VETAFQHYKRVVLEQPLCEDPWFSEALVRYRGGDGNARLQILGSVLRVPLQAVERQFQQASESDLLDHIQDANVTLTTTLERFTGASAEEFVRQIEHEISLCLQELRT
jgi:hypothetical protein